LLFSGFAAKQHLEESNEIYISGKKITSSTFPKYFENNDKRDKPAGMQRAF